MSKEEIISSILSDMGNRELIPMNVAVVIWDAAIELAAEKALMLYHNGDNKTDSPIKHFQAGVNNLKVDKQSILQLKFKK